MSLSEVNEIPVGVWQINTHTIWDQQSRHGHSQSQHGQNSQIQWQYSCKFCFRIHFDHWCQSFSRFLQVPSLPLLWLISIYIDKLLHLPSPPASLVFTLMSLCPCPPPTSSHSRPTHQMPMLSITFGVVLVEPCGSSRQPMSMPSTHNAWCHNLLPYRCRWLMMSFSMKFSLVLSFHNFVGTKVWHSTTSRPALPQPSM